MLGYTQLDLFKLSKYMNIGTELSNDPSIFENLDEEVWNLARNHEHIPDFDRTYCLAIGFKLENLVKAKYPTINVNFYIEEHNLHFFVDYQEVTDITDFKLVLQDFVQKQVVEWIPEKYMKLSRKSGIGIKIKDNKVQYSFAQNYHFGNVQEATLKTESIDKEDGTGIEHKQYFETYGVGQKIYLDDFEDFNADRYRKMLDKELSEIGLKTKMSNPNSAFDVRDNGTHLDEEKSALYNTLYSNF